MRPRHLVLLTVVSLATVLACSHEGEVELAPFMGRMQVFSQKLGYSLQAQNAELAGFYLHELEETIEEIQELVPTHDGSPIGKMAEQMMVPVMEQLEKALKTKTTTWQRRWPLYKDIIATCNDCHRATAHSYIRITPAQGHPPFNQDFRPQTRAAPK